MKPQYTVTKSYNLDNLINLNLSVSVTMWRCMAGKITGVRQPRTSYDMLLPCGREQADKRVRMRAYEKSRQTARKY